VGFVVVGGGLWLVFGVLVPRGRTRAKPRGRVRLKTDAKYAAELKKVRNSRPQKGAAPLDVAKWHCRMSSAEFYARDYAKAELHARKALESDDLNPMLHANLSVCLGKQGKYAEAEEEAAKALGLAGADVMHCNLVLACWELKLGKKKQAQARVEGVPPPTGARRRGVYHGCRACFYAVAGDEEQTAAEIRRALRVDPSNRSRSRTFFERDVAFDPSRGEGWFLDLVGQTLDAGADAPGEPGR
jgi:tetratricopeptide (TPR) repeat protein